MNILSTALVRLSAIALFTAFAATALQAQMVEQPLLRAPWSGSAVITQGNHGATSHHANGSWDNTYALDIDKVGVETFDVLAPAAGVVDSVKDDTSGSGGRQLRVRVNGLNGQTYVLVFMHLSRIKTPFLTKGAAVRAGDIIAVSGGSGNNSETGWPAHLHFHIWSGVGEPDSHTIGIQRLRMKGPNDTDYREYESIGDGVDDATRLPLEDWAVAGKTFASDNAPPAAQQLVRNPDFERITTSTNSAPDGSWMRTYFTGTDFFTLRGGAGSTWGRGGTAGYLYLGHANNSRQIVDSHTFTIPATATRVRFRYYASVITEETASYPYDTLRVSVVDVPTGWEHLVGYFDNRNKTANDSTNVPGSYREQEVELTGYAGATVKLRFDARNDAVFVTRFRIDDVTLTAE
ncbi:MAG TPA: M23 family metallopeptidase [Thermoanaerobaculia bacterium]|nr:M23 family metallopeptidase [Thermoanaerobaculia bacterium]